jgi:hypothetical protein
MLIVTPAVAVRSILRLPTVARCEEYLRKDRMRSRGQQTRKGPLGSLFGVVQQVITVMKHMLRNVLLQRTSNSTIEADFSNSYATVIFLSMRHLHGINQLVEMVH